MFVCRSCGGTDHRDKRNKLCADFTPRVMGRSLSTAPMPAAPLPGLPTTPVAPVASGTHPSHPGPSPSHPGPSPSHPGPNAPVPVASAPASAAAATRQVFCNSCGRAGHKTRRHKDCPNNTTRGQRSEVEWDGPASVAPRRLPDGEWKFLPEADEYDLVEESEAFSVLLEGR